MSWMTGAAAQHVQGGLRHVGQIRLVMMILQSLGYGLRLTSATRKTVKAGHPVLDLDTRIGRSLKTPGDLTSHLGISCASDPLPRQGGRPKNNVFNNLHVRGIAAAPSGSSGLATNGHGLSKGASAAGLLPSANRRSDLPLERGDTLIPASHSADSNVAAKDSRTHDLEVLPSMRPGLVQKTLRHVITEVHSAVPHADKCSHVFMHVDRSFRR